MLSIVTPSFNQLNWLKLCAASVADQNGVEFEHIVQDACTGGGLNEWAAGQRIKLFVEQDDGMYDALNRGLRRSKGELCAYLNCDEQYLPEALARVAAHFKAHPDLDVLLADSLVVDSAGRYICTRPALTPLRWPGAYAFSPMPVLTSGIFFRREVFEQHGIFFRPEWKIVGDAVWMGELVQKQLRITRAGFTTSVFTETGENLCLDSRFLTEQTRYRSSFPSYWQPLKHLLLPIHRLRKLFHGQYRSRPLTYEIYTLQSPGQRRRFEVSKSSSIWWDRIKGTKPNEMGAQQLA